MEAIFCLTKPFIRQKKASVRQKKGSGREKKPFGREKKASVREKNRSKKEKERSARQQTGFGRRKEGSERETTRFGREKTRVSRQRDSFEKQGYTEEKRKKKGARASLLALASIPAGKLLPSPLVIPSLSRDLLLLALARSVSCGWFVNPPSQTFSKRSFDFAQDDKRREPSGRDAGRGRLEACAPLSSFCPREQIGATTRSGGWRARAAARGRGRGASACPRPPSPRSSARARHR